MQNCLGIEIIELTPANKAFVVVASGNNAYSFMITDKCDVCSAWNVVHAGQNAPM